MPRLRRPDALRVGVISDIHANLTRLDRALDILTQAGADRVVCLGDVVEKGPEPDAVVERLDRAAIPTVRGNHDDNAVRHAELEGPGAAGMSADTLAWLAALPLTREYLWAGRFVHLAHASLSDNRSAVRPGEIPKRMRKRLRSSSADLIVLGHTHVPMYFRHGRHLLCNPGSVTRGRCSRGPTCAVIELPCLSLELYALPGGQRIHTWRDDAESTPPGRALSPRSGY